MKTTTNHARTVGGLSVTLVVALAAAACSAPESQQPATSTGDTSAAAVQQPATSSGEAPQPAAVQQPAAAAPAPAPAPPAPPAPPPPPKPRVAQLTAGQVLTVRTTRDLSTKTMKSGDAFSAILEEPITSDGWVVAATGARVDGRIAEADKGGRVKGKASLSIELTSLTLADGRKVEIVTSPFSSEAAANKSGDAKKIGVAAGAGAAVGAIAGGGQGAAIGALVGGGAGAAMRGDAAVIPAETVVGFELRSPVTIREQK